MTIKKPLIIGLFIFTALCGNITAYASSGSFTIYPSHTHNGNRNWIIRDAAPGNRIEESLTLENLSDTPQQLTIEIKEARAENGAFIPVPAESYNDIGNWMDMPQNSFRLAPHETARIPFTIEVPADAGIGKYNAAVFAVKKETGANGINIVTQIGVRVYLDVVPFNPGMTDVFNTYGLKNSLFFLLSAAGVCAGILYYLISHFEKNKHSLETINNE